MPLPQPDAATAYPGDRLYAGRPVPVRAPDSAVGSWPPGANCTIPSAEGVNAPIHPKVLDFAERVPGGTWNGYRYWMAWTPYPNAGNADTKEQPCIVASNDGDTWVAPAANPIVPAPPNVQQNVQYNSDTHLVYEAAANCLYLIWRLFDDLNYQWGEILKYKVSTTGTAWSEELPMNLMSTSASDRSMLLSPAVELWNGTWYCWTLRRNVTPIAIELRTAPAISGPWSAPTNCNIVLADTAREPWHLDVVRIPNGWAMLICDRVRNGSPGHLLLAYGNSAGTSWAVQSAPISTAAPNTYRSSLVRRGAGFDVWATDNDARKIRRLRIDDAQV